MLRRINRLHNAGIFKDYKWDTSLADFERLTLIYGPNGSGKTSIASSILMACINPAQRNVVELIAGDADSSHIALSTDDIFNRIYVFSEAFVKSNHSLNEGEATMSAVITLGQRTVDAETELTELTAQLPTLQSLQAVATAAKVSAEAAVDRVREQVSTRVVEDLTILGGKYQSRSNFTKTVVENQYKDSRDGFALLVDSAYQSDKQLVLSQKDEEIPPLRDFGLRCRDDLVADVSGLLAATPTSIMLDTLQAQPQAEQWVRAGLDLHKHSDQCLFCGSPLAESRRMEIDAHFSEEVERVNEGLRSISAELTALRNSAVAAKNLLPARNDFSLDHRNERDKLADQFVGEVDVLIGWSSTLKDRIEAKAGNVAGAADVDPVDQVPDVKLDSFTALIADHNQRVLDHKQIKAAAGERIRNHHFKASELAYDSGLVALDEAMGTEREAKDKLAAAQSRIIELQTVEGSIVPSAEMLTSEVARLLGRRELEFKPVGNDRYEVTRNGEPAHGLSEGERTVITLVHFLELVRKHDAQSKGKAIVIIDDPVSSLDHGVFIGVSAYLWSAIVATKSDLEQLILLTHNFELFRQWDVQYENLPKRVHSALSYATFEIVSRFSGTVRHAEIRKWPSSTGLRKKSRSAYHHAFISIANAQKDLLASGGNFETKLEAQLLFPNVIRRLLETFLAFKRPGQMSGLSEAMAAIDDALSASEFEGDSGALRHDLLRYSNVYSHSESPESNALVSPEETLPAINAVFEFMYWVDAEHFQGMCTATGLDASVLVPKLQTAPSQGLSL